jgi:hypothetical protein
MLGHERLLADRQRALIEWSRPRKVALVRKQASEVVETRPRVWMLGPERLLADRQRGRFPYILGLDRLPMERLEA